MKIAIMNWVSKKNHGSLITYLCLKAFPPLRTLPKIYSLLTFKGLREYLRECLREYLREFHYCAGVFAGPFAGLFAGVPLVG